MNSDKIVASIILLTKNGEQYLEEVLRQVFLQQTDFKYEVIVIDSGSTDSTHSIVKQFPVKLVEIDSVEFGHGKTRNYGAELALGEYLVFLTQDASPYDASWLKSLVDGFASNDRVAGVFSKWIPREGCNIFERLWIKTAYSNNPELIDIEKFRSSLTEVKILFSNVSSCVRKDIFCRFPFAHDAVYAEDYQWGNKILEEGYKIAYAPDSLVWHSHDDTFKVRFKRSFDSGVAFNDLLNASKLKVKIPLSYSLREFSLYCKENDYNILNRLFLLTKIVLDTLLINFAGFLGKNNRRIPAKLRGLISTVPHMWIKK